MLKRSSRITMLMLIVVFCAFAFAACGTTKDNTKTTTDQTTDTTKNETTTNNAKDISLTITSPADGDTIEGGKVTVVGNVKGKDLNGIDKVKIQVLADDGTVLGEDTAAVADLDQQYSADVKYDLGNNVTKDSDGTVKAKIRAYIEGDTNTAAEKTISVKLK